MRISVTALLLASALAVAGVSVAVHAAVKDSGALPAKDQTRLPADEALVQNEDYGTTLVQLAQAVRPPPPGDDHGPAGTPDGDRASPFHHTMGPPAGPFGPPPFMRHHRRGPVPLTRAGCEEDINRHAGIAGYIKSKLNLQGNQKDAWRKIEEAAEPAVAKLRAVCAQLPVDAVPPPALPDRIEFAAKQTAARAEFLQAVSGPVRALYDTLSPDQRAALIPPMHRPL
jgi:hypothetical protein